MLIGPCFVYDYLALFCALHLVNCSVREEPTRSLANIESIHACSLLAALFTEAHFFADEMAHQLQQWNLFDVYQEHRQPQQPFLVIWNACQFGWCQWQHMVICWHRGDGPFLQVFWEIVMRGFWTDNGEWYPVLQSNVLWTDGFRYGLTGKGQRREQAWYENISYENGPKYKPGVTLCIQVPYH